jgi:putative tryptophan/tyrosine transport system substrate-binding protein
MNRRDAVPALLALGATPYSAWAQQPGRTVRVALILGTSPVAEMAGPDPAHPYVRAFLHELRDRDFVEGKNLVFERRSAEGNAERTPAIVEELVRIKKR